MAWTDKPLEAKYTSPSGGEFVFTWEKSLSRETELKTGIFTFPDRDGAHVQHQGAGPRSFPMECIFTGPNCMDEADAFEAALIERDAAELQHPIYGVVKVMPTGNIKREDDLVGGLNESRVTITFTETITDESPTQLETAAADELEEQYEEFSESAVSDFAENISVESVSEELQLQSIMEVQAQSVEDNLSGLMASDSASFADFKTVTGELKASIAELKTDRYSDLTNLYNSEKNLFKNAEKMVTKALNSARLALNAMKMPSCTAVNIMEKIKGYSRLLADIAKQSRNDPFGITNIKNSFASTSLVLQGCTASIASGAAFLIAKTASSASGGVSASRSMAFSEADKSDSGGIDPAGTSAGSEASSGNSIAAGDGGGTISREETVIVMNQIVSMLETVKQFQDTKISSNAFIDSSSGTYLLLTELVYASIQLIQIASFSLPMQRTIKLGRDRQVIELCCELYGSSDYLDKFIAENDLGIDEIELIPMGREITYYVKVA
jgi:hypothetical protein